MRRLTPLALFLATVAAVTGGVLVSTQSKTAVQAAVLVQTDSLRAETNRKGGLAPRKTVIRRLATRIDSIMLAWVPDTVFRVDTVFVRDSVPVPPVDTTSPPDTASPPDTTTPPDTTPEIPPVDTTTVPPSSLPAVLPALPTTFLNTTYTAPTGRVIDVPPTASLQRAIDTAQRGDVIQLQPGATYSGTFVLRAKSGTGWIVIRTAAPDASLPAPGQRLTPSYASQLPKLVTNALNTSTLTTEPGASFYRLIGLEITAPASHTLLFALVQFGGVSAQQTSLAQVPTDIILDRSWVHGHGTLNLQRCVLLNSARTAVIDSYLSQCHAKGFDSQAILGYNGPGPFKITNNYLEGAGENVMFGGADPGIPNLVPSDIEIRGNHFYKPASWRGVWTVKNLLELKNAKRVIIENNILENNWADAQAGFALPWKSVNQDGRAPWSETSDVTFRYNIVRNSAAGLSIAANPEVYTAVPASRFLVEHNLFYSIGSFNGTQNGRMVLLTQALKDVTIRHNTFVHNAAVGNFLVLDVSGGGQNLVIRDNITTPGGPYGPMSGNARQGTDALNLFSTPWAFDRNVIVGWASLSGWYPASTMWPATLGDVGFVNPAADNYQLSASSLYRNTGADYAGVMARTAGVVVQP